MMMYHYDLSRIAYILHSAGATGFAAELTDHGGELGATLYARVGSRAAAEPRRRRSILSQTSIYSSQANEHSKHRSCRNLPGLLDPMGGTGADGKRTCRGAHKLLVLARAEAMLRSAPGLATCWCSSSIRQSDWHICSARARTSILKRGSTTGWRTRARSSRTRSDIRTPPLSSTPTKCDADLSASRSCCDRAGGGSARNAFADCGQGHPSDALTHALAWSFIERDPALQDVVPELMASCVVLPGLRAASPRFAPEGMLMALEAARRLAELMQTERHLAQVESDREAERDALRRELQVAADKCAQLHNRRPGIESRSRQNDCPRRWCRARTGGRANRDWKQRSASAMRWRRYSPTPRAGRTRLATSWGAERENAAALGHQLNEGAAASAQVAKRAAMQDRAGADSGDGTAALARAGTYPGQEERAQ